MGSFIIFTHHNIIRQIKSRIIRWAGHVAHMGRESPKKETT
jgi:hypothetical protein